VTTNATSTAGDNDNLLIPIIFIVDPIIRRASVQVAICPTRKTQIKQELKPAKGQFMQDGQVLALLCEAREQD
jgi:hypothetical protein